MRTLALMVAVGAFGGLAGIDSALNAGLLSPARTHTAVLRLPRGRAVGVFRLSAPTAVSHDVTVRAPATVALSVVTQVNGRRLTLSVL
jgi:hypothetical protein